MKKVFIVLLLGSYGLFAEPLSGKFQVGNVENLFDEFVKGGALGSVDFVSSSSEIIPLEPADYYYEDGRFSMTGRARQRPQSEFIMKGDGNHLYGWLVLRDRNLAYEYTTDAYGTVLVEQVPVTKIFPVCNIHPDRELSPPAIESKAPFGLEADSLTPHIGDYPGVDVRTLQSLPGAEKVWYINLTDVMNGAEPIDQSKQDVWQTWQSLAAILSTYDVNVTTDPEVYAAAGVRNSGIADMVNYDPGGSSSCGIGVFGTTRACTAKRYRNGYSTGRILAHEVGHGLGLYHDGGDNGGQYFNGFSQFQWTPLMGNIWPGDRWNNALYQFSKGEYNSATQKQDDFMVVGRHLEFKEDDIPETRALVIQGTNVPAISNRGLINSNTDSDAFTFQIGSGGGSVDLTIDRIEYMGGAMLDVDASIEDAGGNVVVRDNQSVARDAQLQTNLEPGTYTLIIQGGAEGTLQNGFSKYSSVGYYGIEGTIEGSASVPVARGKALKEMRVHPLSSTSQLQFDVPKTLQVKGVSLYNTAGARVYHAAGRVETIDMSGYALGIYTLRVATGSGNFVRNIVKT